MSALLAPVTSAVLMPGWISLLVSTMIFAGTGVGGFYYFSKLAERGDDPRLGAFLLASGLIASAIFGFIGRASSLAVRRFGWRRPKSLWIDVAAIAASIGVLAFINQ